MELQRAARAGEYTCGRSAYLSTEQMYVWIKVGCMGAEMAATNARAQV